MEEVRCVHCGSDNVRRERYSHRWAAILMLLFGFMIPVRSVRIRCFECGAQFRTKAGASRIPGPDKH